MVKWRPKVAPYRLVVQAKTVAAGKPTTLSVSPQTARRLGVDRGHPAAAAAGVGDHEG